MILETRICKKTDNNSKIMKIISVYDMLYQPIVGQVINEEYVVIGVEDSIFEDAIYRYVYVI